MPDHDGVGGHFKRINPVMTAQFFREYITRRNNMGTPFTAQINARRTMVVDFVDGNIEATLKRVNQILDEEITCNDRSRRETPASKKTLEPIRIRQISLNQCGR